MRARAGWSLLATSLLLSMAMPARAEPDAVGPASPVAVPAETPTITIVFRLQGPVPANAAFGLAGGDGGAYLCVPTWVNTEVGSCEATKPYTLLDEPLQTGWVRDLRIVRWIYATNDPGAEQVGSETVFDIHIVVGETDQTYTYTYIYPSTSIMPDTAMSPAAREAERHR